MQICCKEESCTNDLRNGIKIQEFFLFFSIIQVTSDIVRSLFGGGGGGGGK